MVLYSYGEDIKQDEKFKNKLVLEAGIVDIYGGTVMTDKYNVIMINLANFLKIEPDINNELHALCSLFVKGKEKFMKQAIAKYPMIYEINEEIQKCLMTDEDRDDYDAYLEDRRKKTAMFDYREQKGKEEGIKEGSLKKQIEIAKKLLVKKYSLDFINEITGLSKEEIIKLK